MEPETISAFHAVLSEVTLRFAFAFDRREFQTSIDALDRGWVEPRAMITGSVSLTETPAMFEALRTAKEACKVMIDPWA
jgi:(R,R)-butanediol dehydrogenase/meso-butanediol dehydrogenase/diacetyl reductase